ncbi:alpha/beta hydrolase [Pseudoxanthomonas dokdonensis]|uniref:Xylanase n=1 Tax=Pseudoxanthomonas dokdonensis TaxID=344882 RepID=A0A0R0CHZ7_9GAMM|nr:alpha/beta hydrolase [Pseudoxanthomonas dokdonensis]KRG69548.1 xylanase [Pseudoxanthomonas dokdonensis]
MHYRKRRPAAGFNRQVASRTLAWLALAISLSAGVQAAAETVASETPTEAASRIPLWPDGLAPADVALADAQRIVERSRDPSLPDRAMTRISQPYLVVYRPASPNGAALLVTPGGGYARVVLDKEGSALVPAFVDHGGYTLFVLRYRLPGEGHPQAADVPLADAQRAMRLVRAHAAEFAIDPRRIGVMGFSAGGHVAASLATRFDESVYPAVDDSDALSARPDLQLLIYPVIGMDPSIAHPGSRTQLLGNHPDAAQESRYSPQRHVGRQTPPAFLLHAQDDEVVPVANTQAYLQALLQAQVPVEAHIFPVGGHGFGVRGIADSPLRAWPRLAMDWMQWQFQQNTKTDTGAAR